MKRKGLSLVILCGVCAFAVASRAAAPPTKEADVRLQAEGKGWRLDKAKVIDPKRPRVLLIGDSILNGYKKHVIEALKGKAYVDLWVNPYCQSEYLNTKVLPQVLAQGPYDVVHFNMGLHGWQKGRIKDGTFEPLTRAYVQVIRNKLPEARIIWASSTPVTVKGKPTELEPQINPVIIEHNRMAAKVMAEMKVPVNDLYGLLADKLKLARGDRFHWTAPAYKILAVKVIDSLQRELKASPGGHRAEWLHQARWGVMTHYLGAAPSSRGGAELTAEMWNKQIDAFKVEALADQVASTGAKYLLFTLGQNSGHYCSPNATYDKIVGIRPSKCSRRDLVAELAKALKKRGVRLMVYLPSGAPAADPVARKKLKWLWGRKGGWQLPGEKVGGRLAEFQKHWEAVVREWSLRWGKDVAGWWIDGTYFPEQMYRFAEAPNFASFAAALRAGNPDSIVAFNPGIRVPVIVHTRHEDYTAGEVGLRQLPKAVAACPGRFLTRKGAKVQYQILTYLGTSWCKGESPQWPDEKVITLVRHLAGKGGAITFDVPISWKGVIPGPFIKQLKAIGRSLPAGTKSPAGPK